LTIDQGGVADEVPDEDLVHRGSEAADVGSLAARLTAASIAYELGDLRRFPSAKKLMSYIGATPCEDSSGDRVRRGRITRAGNTALRRLFVESAWAYRHRPNEGYRHRKRAERAAPAVRAIAWKAQTRLNARYKRMLARGKSKQKTLVAVARELAGFIWAVGQEDQLTQA
jgi:transposase